MLGPMTKTITPSPWRQRRDRIHRFSGPDSADFLQRLSTVDLKKWPVGGLVRGLFLDGTGTLVAWFRAYREAPQSFLLISAAEETEPLTAHIEKYTFAEEQSLAELKGARVFEVFSAEFPDGATFPPNSAAALGRTQLPVSLVGADACLVWRETTEQARLVVFSGPDLPPLLQGLGPENHDENFWELLRLLRLEPKRGQEWNEPVRALDLGLHLSIDRFKGCYPGQEAVEKSLNLGHPARVLAQISLRGLPEPLLGSAVGAAGFPELRLETSGEPKIDAGRISSLVKVPELLMSICSGDALGLALVKWGQRDQGREFSLAGYPGRAAIAKIIEEADEQ